MLATQERLPVMHRDVQYAGNAGAVASITQGCAVCWQRRSNCQLDLSLHLSLSEALPVKEGRHRLVALSAGIRYQILHIQKGMQQVVECQMLSLNP